MIDDATFTSEAQQMIPSLYRLSQSILRAPSDAQDAVQQGLLRAWEKRAQVREDRFRAWLTRIVINECRNIQRRRMRVFPVEEVPEQAVPQGDSPDGELREAISALPQKLRTPLLLRYMERYSEQEIALALGVPVSTVKNRLYRARQALRRELSGAEVVFK